jgi:rhodanese-related sulfurtransferase
MQTIGGVLAIVGLGYLCGIGQAFMRDVPVILGAQPTTTNSSSLPEDADSVIEDTQVQVESDPIESTPNTVESPVDTDPLLDAPVPEGMLSLREALQLWNDGAYFIDSRLRDEFDAGHISGAAYLTAETFFSPEGEAEMTTIPPDATVVIYCIGGEECDASKNTLALLQQSGFTDLRIMGVGYDEWAAAGLETEVSP